ncbi:MAG: barstar family protein [Treponema sp.]|nr:barstar family protein [Treponema sp.]
MKIDIDLKEITDRNSLHELLQSALHLPSYYGKNLDALYDALTEPHEELDIHFAGTEHAAGSLGDSYTQALRLTFADAEAEGAAVHAEWH